ncbi:(Fe-S)-binding protein [Paenibacillus melissococcoides]|uniref:(Fe-S)-binding protein n=1 Tax=Paenibacillus melissococcoides TaxID=2912268 RepID=A0ABM9G1D5_9BACL|nr:MULTISPECIES: (Fe-S)-binding protein [Paenibacillus]MEB9893726.1 (Fe-S)-binding protein [Bacillus cereus]CAH8245427.1 (Fe-S)-binding protein [Paenibacillus melissococcoides]CAH8710913.1 (Fe-S)-binding protein [Paenibacillus melissococcoides]CAH8711714.1 (Fe-S)-binding protein [Paenibacillus melissococcoides]GIO77674.1 Fe-S oxidoreductase [Paenibacillus dendritiformis]
MRVSLFVTCLADTCFPDVAESTVRLLHRLGCDVDFPRLQTCCGQPAFNSGYHDDAREVARQWLRAFEHSDYIVTPSGSCAGMACHYYGDLFREEPAWQARAERAAQRTYELSQFIVKVLRRTDVGAAYEGTATYHPSCHGMRLLGIGDEPMTLLRHVKGLKLVDLPHQEDCCGFGGTFAVKMPEMSGAMVTEKAEHVVSTQAEILIGTDMGCLMNIGGRLNQAGKPIRVMHLAQLLEEGVKRA